MELDHFVKNFGINSLEENIRLERSFGPAFTKRNIVTGTNVFTVVESTSRAVAAVSNRFEKRTGCGEGWQSRRMIQSSQP